jgi:hypothetical protein
MVSFGERGFRMANSLPASFALPADVSETPAFGKQTAGVRGRLLIAAPIKLGSVQVPVLFATVSSAKRMPGNKRRKIADFQCELREHTLQFL